MQSPLCAGSSAAITCVGVLCVCPPKGTRTDAEPTVESNCSTSPRCEAVFKSETSLSRRSSTEPDFVSGIFSNFSEVRAFSPSFSPESLSTPKLIWAQPFSFPCVCDFDTTCTSIRFAAPLVLKNSLSISTIT